MAKAKHNGAVIYVRVSTDEQANGPLNLEQSGEAMPGLLQVRKTYQSSDVFIDPGESARSADRPEFQRMLAFCKAHRREVRFVVVQDLSRFARNLQDQDQTIVRIKYARHYWCVRYTRAISTRLQTGKWQANILRQRSTSIFRMRSPRRCKIGHVRSVAAGRFPWRAPIGYKNIGGKERCRTSSPIARTCAPDPPRV